MEPFASQVAALESTLATQRDVAVARLRATQEEWARAVLGLASTRRPDGGWAFDKKLVADVRGLVEGGLEPERAVEAEAHLAAAENWQWEIGSWSSGPGEGLSSMFEVRSLQLARAWLIASRAPANPAAAEEARKLGEQVANDPNDVAARHRKHFEALFAFLGG